MNGIFSNKKVLIGLVVAVVLVIVAVVVFQVMFPACGDLPGQPLC